MEEQKNRFERAAARPTLTDDRKNRFERHTETEAATRREDHSLSRQDAQERTEKERSVWAGDGRGGGVRTTSGVPLDPETLRLKQASDADRAARQNPSQSVALLSLANIEAITVFWESRHPELFQSEFNAENMKNFILRQMSLGATFGIELLDFAFRWLTENNYLEQQFVTPRRRGEGANKPAPRVYPEFVTPAQEAERGREEGEEAAARHIRDVAAALTLPFAELQKKVRAANPNYGQRFAGENI